MQKRGGTRESLPMGRHFCCNVRRLGADKLAPKFYAFRNNKQENYETDAGWWWMSSLCFWTWDSNYRFSERFSYFLTSKSRKNEKWFKKWALKLKTKNVVYHKRKKINKKIEIDYEIFGSKSFFGSLSSWRFFIPSYMIFASVR